jgi:hypothetical protein
MSDLSFCNNFTPTNVAINFLSPDGRRVTQSIRYDYLTSDADEFSPFIPVNSDQELTEYLLVALNTIVSVLYMQDRNLSLPPMLTSNADSSQEWAPSLVAYS